MFLMQLFAGRLYALGTVDSQYDVYRFTRFTKEQLRDLVPRLRMPHHITVEYNQTQLTLPCEFILVLTLCRLTSGESYHTLQIKFGYIENFLGSFVTRLIRVLFFFS